jgi:ribosomal protein L6P/L9E
MKSLNISISTKTNLNKQQMLFYVPLMWKVVFFNFVSMKRPSVLCYMYSNSYYYNLPLFRFHKQLFYDQQTHVVTLTSMYTNNFFNTYWTNLKLIFNSFSTFFFKKLKFKGKGYYIYKSSRHTLGLQFGYAHIVRIYTFFVGLKFLSKTAIMLFGLNKDDLLSVSHTFRLARPYNIFTGKGVRFTRQIIYKKTGKISSYR